MQPTSRYEPNMRALYAFDSLMVWGDGEENDASGTSDSQAGSGDGSSDDGDGADSSDDGKERTFDAVYVKKLRAEAAEARVKAKEANAELASSQAKLREREQADMTDVEKMRSDLELAQTALATATTERDSAASSLRDERINSAVIVKATSLGFNDPSDALSMIDVSELTDDEGAVKPKAVTGALEKLAKQKPYLVGSGKGSGDGGPLGKTPPDPKSPEAMRAGYAKHFKKQGRIPIGST